MTQKEKENVRCALSNAINELKYYQRAKWLNDTGALERVKEFLSKILFKTKKE